MLPYEHFVIVLSSPSGTGKSTLAKMLLEKYSNIKLSTSATTRAPREGEIDGFHYYFHQHLFSSFLQHLMQKHLYLL